MASPSLIQRPVDSQTVGTLVPDTRSTSFTIHTVQPEEAESIIRTCDFPANFDNPLRLLAWPVSITKQDWEQEICMNIESLQESIEEPDQYIRKVCDSNGKTIGFACWSVFEGGKATKKENERPQGNAPPRKRRDIPEKCDFRTWAEFSRHLAAERNRVLAEYGEIWRLTKISVIPEYQRRGVGSMLMAWGCKQADNEGLDCFVMASPQAVRLYEKFGFLRTGTVELRGAVFTSMLRRGKR